jgi:uncharacterized protein (DUF433 family)
MTLSTIPLFVLLSFSKQYDFKQEGHKLSLKIPLQMDQPIKSWRGRITTNPEQCGGRPCIRGMRIRVVDVLDLLAAGLSRREILEELPDLEAEDVEAAILYARSRLDHPVIAA